MAKSSSEELLSADDSQIVELFFSRDQSALTATDQRYHRYLYTVAYNIVKDRQDSEECLNDVYLALWKSIPPHRPRSFKAYITTLTRRIATDIYRKHKRQRRVPDEMESSLSELEFLLYSNDTTERAVEASQLSDALNRFLEGISKEDRALFVCRYYLCMSVEDITLAKGTNKAVLYKKLGQIKKQLKDQLEKEGFLL